MNTICCVGSKRMREGGWKGGKGVGGVEQRRGGGERGGGKEKEERGRGGHTTHQMRKGSVAVCAKGALCESWGEIKDKTKRGQGEVCPFFLSFTCIYTYLMNKRRH